MKISTLLQPKNCFYEGQYDQFTKIKNCINPLNKLYPPSTQLSQHEINFLRKNCYFNFL